MADLIDTAQERAEQILESQIKAARQPVGGVSTLFCIDCNHPIPEVRRAALLGVELCITCKSIAELKARNYRGQ